MSGQVPRRFRPRHLDGLAGFQGNELRDVLPLRFERLHNVVENLRALPRGQSASLLEGSSSGGGRLFELSGKAS